MKFLILPATKKETKKVFQPSSFPENFCDYSVAAFNAKAKSPIVADPLCLASGMLI